MLPTRGARYTPARRRMFCRCARERYWFTQLRCGLEDALDFVAGENVGNGSRPILTAEDGGRYFVALVFGTDVPRKSDHLAKPASSRRQQWCRSSPLDGGFRANVVFARRFGERCKAVQQAAFGPECESRGPAHGHVRLHGLGQHDFTSGHGCATCRRVTTSTLA